MNIQIITYKGVKIPDCAYQITSLNKPMSLDMYDVNIINLNHSGLWEYTDTDTSSINEIRDLRSIASMLFHAQKAVSIIVLPGNFTYKFCYDKYNGYKQRIQLKDMMGSLRKILMELIPSLTQFGILYENNITTIGETQYSASFYFNTTGEDAEEVLTYSDGSHKPNTVVVGERMLATTLDVLNCGQELDAYLKCLGLLPDERSPYPNWLEDYVFGDDREQRELIRNKKLEIEAAQASIQCAKQKLSENLAYKSILYTNGAELVGDVFRILEQILDCDLSGFVDKKKEDFLIRLEEVTLIGEIKGVTSNVKSEHVSQLETHYYGYMDALEEKGESEQVKQLLIISPFRTKPLDQREPVHENQINLALRNHALIIETRTLLLIFEKFQKGELDAGAILEKLMNASGILTEEDFG